MAKAVVLKPSVSPTDRASASVKAVWELGMPSSHTAFTLALALSVGLTDGFNTTAFAIAFALMGVVVYDAMGVRYETGKQGAVINQILNELFVEGKPLTDERLKELVGHSPIEVLGGALTGIIIILIFYL